MLLVENCDLYAPGHLGMYSLLVAGGRVVALEKKIDAAALPGEVVRIDAAGRPVVPGFVDGHQHFTGGGGEGGFHTRTPEMQVSMNFANGVTTAVGLLGTDSLTRSVEALYAKTEAFNNEGLTALMLTGSYWHPSPTITGTIAGDMTFIGPVIGLKLAIADTRGPFLNGEILAAIASDIRVSALVAGKPGVITLHTGIKEERLALVREVVERHRIRADMFVTTHVNRKDPALAEEVFALGDRGLNIDATCTSDVAPEDDPHLCAADFACEVKARGLYHRLTFSSDAGGSLPKWDADHKNIIGMGVGTPSSLGFELNRMITALDFPVEEALLPFTLNPAKLYGLKGRKGEIRVGADADLLILDSCWRPATVIAGGRVVKSEGRLVACGFFEQTPGEAP